MKKNLLRKLAVFMPAALLAVPALLTGQTYQWDYCSAGTTATPTTGTAASNDLAKGVTLDGRGNVYVVGPFGSSNTSTATFGGTTLTSLGGSDIFIQKMNRSGTVQWAVQGKGLHDDDARSVCVYPDGTGGVNTYVTGYYQGVIRFTSTDTTTKALTAPSGVATDWNMFIVKYNDAGVAQWALSCGNATGTDIHIGYDIAVKYNAAQSAVCIWVAGSYMGTTSFGTGYNITAGAAGKQNGFVACYLDGSSAPAGGALWADAMKGTNTIQELGVDADKNGHCYVTGYDLANCTFGTTSGSTITVNMFNADDGTVSTYDGNGVLLSADHWGSNTGSTGTVGRGIVVDKAGFIYVVGTFSNTSTFLGSGISKVSAGGNDGFIMQLDNNGTTVNWVQTIASAGADAAERVAVDNCGKRCYVTGSYNCTSTSGTVNFGNGITLSPYSSTTTTDAYLVDFDASNGNAIAATRAGKTTGAYTDQGLDVAVNAVEDIVYTGSFTSSTITFDPSGSSVLTNGGNADGFVARWDHSDWPALETSACHASHQGVSVVDCSDYAVGDINGTASFGSLTNTASSDDIYLLECDKYATYQNFVLMTNGSSSEKSKDIVSDATNSFHYMAGSAVTGATSSGVTFVNDATDSYTSTSAVSHALVIKSDLSGSINATNCWATSVRGGASGAAYGQGVTFDSNKNVYFCGYFSGTVTFYNAGATSAGTLTSAGGTDVFVVKYNSAGAVQWKKKYGGVDNEHGLAISIDPADSCFYITGDYSGTTSFKHSSTSTGGYDGFVMRGRSSDGSAVNDAFWGSAGNNDVGNDVYSNGISEVYVTGMAVANEAYIASYDLTGTTSPSPTWTYNSTGGTAIGNDILLGNQGYVYVAGNVTGTTVSFGSFSYATNCAFVVGLTSWNGILTWASTGYNNATSYGLAEDLGDIANDHGYALIFGGTVASGGCNKAYLHKATEEGCELTSRIGYVPPADGNSTSSPVVSSTIYPNPFGNTATLKLESFIDPSASPVSIEISDMTGRVVQRLDGITSQETTISSENLGSGIYFYRVVQNGTIVSTGKMMINK